MKEKKGRLRARRPRAHTVPSRPRMEGYGIPRGREGMLSWERGVRRLEKARNYWVGTTRPGGRPHAMPVWGVWVDDALYFGTGRRSRKARNLKVNSTIVIHLESGDDALILEGVATVVSERSLLERVDREYLKKYKMRVTTIPDSMIVEVRPSVAFAWRERDFPKSATRWRFE